MMSMWGNWWGGSTGFAGKLVGSTPITWMMNTLGVSAHILVDVAWMESYCPFQ